MPLAILGMTIPQLAGLLVQFGPSAFDLAERLISKWNTNTPVTLEELAELRKLGERTAREALIERLTLKGIDLQSPDAQRLLALIQ